VGHIINKFQAQVTPRPTKYFLEHFTRLPHQQAVRCHCASCKGSALTN
jgi:hypothetical protein